MNIFNYPELKNALIQEFHFRLQSLPTFEKGLPKPEFSPAAFFWLDQFSNYLELLPFIDDCEDVDREPLTENQDIIFSVLSESEYAKIFLEEHKKRCSIKLAAQNTSIFIREKLKNFENLYFYNKKIQGFYEPIFEFAEFDDEQIGPREADFIFDKEKISFYTFDKAQQKKHVENIQDAFKTLKEAAPESYERLCFFTNTIIPLKEEKMVSYSEQSIPGHSMINLYHRDRVDLLDDLLHENGHHHLNYILNTTELIIEDEEKIYYSPWRETQRPLRGIYHAVFTFYWALDLFHSLLKWDQFETFFNIEEKQKIKMRFLEEFIMLSFCEGYLEEAYAQEKITPEGKEVIDKIFQLLEKKIPLFTKLKDDSIKDLVNKLREVRSKENS